VCGVSNSISTIGYDEMYVGQRIEGFRAREENAGIKGNIREGN